MQRRSSKFQVSSSKFKVPSSRFQVQRYGNSVMLYLFDKQSYNGFKSLILSLPSSVLNHQSFLFVLFSFLFLHSELHAQIETKLEPDVILIGDTASLQITVTVDASQKVILPQTGDSLNSFIEITGKKTDTLQRGNNLSLVHNLTLTCFEPGEFLVNALPVDIDGRIVQSQSQKLVVQDLVVEGDTDKIFPIKPIMPEEITFWEKYKKYFWYFVIGAVLLFIAALIIWLYFKEKKQQKYVSTPLLPPFEEALDNLRKLDKAELVEKQKFYEYYSDLSFILRRYFTRRFDFPANALLSDDLPQTMQNKGYITTSEMKELSEFLKDADLAKYARTVPSAEKHDHYRNWVENLIYRTRPIIEDELSDLGLMAEDEEKLRKIDNR